MGTDDLNFFTPSTQAVSQPVNEAAVVQAVLCAVHLGVSRREWIDIASAIMSNPEAREPLEKLLWAASKGDPDEDCRMALGIGMVAGMLYAQAAGATALVPELHQGPQVA
jgi:hypothetical protein